MIKTIIIVNKIQKFSFNAFDSIEELPGFITNIFITIFPYLLSLTIISLNISLIVGAITYLLDYNERNGKMMIIRSSILMILLIFLFNPSYSDLSPSSISQEKIEPFITFLTSYLLFIFSALSLIIFIGNLGIYLLSPDKKRVNMIKKSGICLACAIIPLGFQFPTIPKFPV